MILFCLNVGEDDDILFTSDDKCFFAMILYMSKLRVVIKLKTQ